MLFFWLIASRAPSLLNAHYAFPSVLFGVLFGISPNFVLCFACPVPSMHQNDTSVPHCMPCPLSPCPPPPSPLSPDSLPPHIKFLLLHLELCCWWHADCPLFVGPHLASTAVVPMSHMMHTTPNLFSMSLHGSVAGRPPFLLFSFAPLLRFQWALIVWLVLRVNWLLRSKNLKAWRAQKYK